jgi:DNA-binding NarL/FixJ family response regulator
MIHIVLADDESLLRAGIRLILEHADDIEVIGEAGDGRQAVELVTRERPDVVLLDIRMPGMDGLTAAEQLARAGLPTKVVMLTTFGEDQYLARALRAGATGFLLKDTAPEALIESVRAAATGTAMLSPAMTRLLIDRYLGQAAGGAQGGEARRLLDTLTDRERDVLRRLGEGGSNAEIGAQLHMSEGTVKGYVSRILTKLECTNRVQAAILAYEAGLLGGDGS